ncbi:MAG: DUF883 C-terminal domain-containing protein [Gemmatimonadetes bacterium]|nr:DUF883 C-terminal domain-containing protein [Gemmatimonadota bacterium]
MVDQARGNVTHPTHPDSVRAELAQTRARMSETIDEIESVLLGKKESLLRTAKGIQQRLDPFYKVRERPLTAVGVVFGIGLAVGVFSGRKRTVVVPAPPPPPPPEPPAESDLWERRARRLLRIAREQEDRLGDLEEQISSLQRPEYDEIDEDDDGYHEEYYAPDEYPEEDEEDESESRGLSSRLRDTLHRFSRRDSSE